MSTKTGSPFEFKVDGIILQGGVDTLTIYHSNEPWVSPLRELYHSVFERQEDMFFNTLELCVPNLSSLDSSVSERIIRTFVSEFNSNSSITTVGITADMEVDIVGKLRNSSRVTTLVLKSPHVHDCLKAFTGITALEIHDADAIDLNKLKACQSIKNNKNISEIRLLGKQTSIVSLDAVYDMFPNITELYIQTVDETAINSIARFTSLAKLGIFSYEVQLLPEDMLRKLPELTSLDLSRTQIGIDTFQLCMMVHEKFPNITEFKVPVFTA